MNLIKKALILGSVLVMSLMTGAYAEEIKLNVNGSVLQPDTPPVIVDGRTLVPLRMVAEALNCDVSWDANTRAVTMFDGKSIYILWIDKDTAFKTDGFSLEDWYIMDVVPQILNDRTMVPIRCISEMFGADVDWIDESKTVTVDYVGNGITVPEGKAEGFKAYEMVLTEQYDVYRDYVTDRKDVTKAEIELADGGSIKIELYNSIAPISVQNFIKLINESAYDGVIFHRVINDFMIQGGAFLENGEVRRSESIIGEFIANKVFNLIPHERGVLSMARANNYNSGSNQFFIVQTDSEHLNGGYAAFGRVYEGMEYVDKIAQVETDKDDKPIEDVVIKTIRIINE